LSTPSGSGRCSLPPTARVSTGRILPRDHRNASPGRIYKLTLEGKVGRRARPIRQAIETVRLDPRNGASVRERDLRRRVVEPARAEIDPEAIGRSVIPGWSEGPDLRCAIAHREISRFRDRCYASRRNDGLQIIRATTGIFRKITVRPQLIESVAESTMANLTAAGNG
jgi:hypothetical protein